MNWYRTAIGRPALVDHFATGGLTAWTCRPGRPAIPGMRWQLTVVGKTKTFTFRKTKIFTFRPVRASHLGRKDPR